MHNVLIIADRSYEYVGTIRAHLNALREVGTVADYRILRRIDLEEWDVIIFHYTVVLANLNIRDREQIGKSYRLKMAFIQDEYRWVDATAAAITDLGISVVFSCVSRASVDQIYRQPEMRSVRFEQTLTGYLDPQLCKAVAPDYENRSVDIGYRARKLPGWYGKHAEQKWRIAEDLVAAMPHKTLIVDLSTKEADRLYGREWVQFLGNCRATIVTESGASVIDYDDTIRRDFEAGIPHKEILGSPAIRALSPRVFEAAALRTLMLIAPGEYNGVLRPGWHGPLLRPDMSNIDEIVRIVRSPALAKVYIERAWIELILSGRYHPVEALARHVRRVIKEESPRATVTPPPSLWVARALTAGSLWKSRGRRVIARKASVLGTMLPPKVRETLRPLARRLLIDETP